MNQKRIAILCAQKKSIYNQIAGLDVFDIDRDAYTFTGKTPIIAHPPCQQWSRMKNFAKENTREKELAMFCLEHVQVNGGIFEHPAGSSFFKYAGITPTISVNQNWFGFPGEKRTYLYFSKCSPLSFPISFDLPLMRLDKMAYRDRSTTTLDFANWLISCIRASKILF